MRPLSCSELKEAATAAAADDDDDVCGVMDRSSELHPGASTLCYIRKRFAKKNDNEKKRINESWIFCNADDKINTI